MSQLFQSECFHTIYFDYTLEAAKRNSHLNKFLSLTTNQIDIIIKYIHIRFLEIKCWYFKFLLKNRSMIIADIAKTLATAAIIIAPSMPVFHFPPSVLIITVTKNESYIRETH
jgi:hypothetical protein